MRDGHALRARIRVGAYWLRVRVLVLPLAIGYTGKCIYCVCVGAPTVHYTVHAWLRGIFALLTTEHAAVQEAHHR